MILRLHEVAKHVRNGYEKKVAVMLWGPPGVGKSSIVKQVAEELGVRLIDVRLAQLEPCDVRGIPAPNHKTKQTEWYYPSWLPTDPESKGILFLDEMEKAPTMVKNAALQLVLDRSIGDYKLPDGWSIVGAGNRADDGCFSTGLGTALNNRMLHYTIEADLESWLKWATANGINDEITGYLQFDTGSLYSMQAGVEAFPSPRSWEFLSNMLKGVTDQEETYQLFEAAVGEAAGQKFRAWYEVYKDVDVEAIILKGKMPKAKEIGGEDKKSFKYAVTIAVSHYVKKNFKDINQSASNVLKFYEHLDPEVRLVFIKQFKKDDVLTLFKARALTEDAVRGLAEVLVGKSSR